MPVVLLLSISKRNSILPLYPDVSLAPPLPIAIGTPKGREQKQELFYFLYLSVRNLVMLIIFSL